MNSHTPVYTMWIEVNGEDAAPFTARPTVHVPACDYTSGDYVVAVADTVLQYSACGVYRAVYGNTRLRLPAPLSGAVTFDFTDHGGPHLTIVSGSMGVTE